MGQHTITDSPAVAGRGDRVFLRGGLLEILVVATILGVVSAIVIGGIVHMKERVSRLACDADVATVALAAQSYFSRNLDYPPTVLDLQKGGYLSRPAGNDHVVVYTRATDHQGFSVTGTTSSGDDCTPSRV